jgi:ATP-dependent Lhr-like helicase
LEWCDRRLLARIHRLTLEGLRRQIAPVPFEQFVRFLIRHQHADAQTILRGQAGLLSLIEQMEGFEAPAGHWEKYLLPARIESYSPAWLDGLTFFGQAGWGRLRPVFSSVNGSKVVTIALSGGGEALIANGRPIKAMTQSTPITLMLRDHVGWLLPEAGPSTEESADRMEFALGGNAHAAYEAFQRHGALFPAQLATLLHLLPSQVDDVLGELAAAGLITSDGYPALRTLLGVKMRSHKRRPGIFGSRARARLENPAGNSAGRWTLLRSPLTPAVSSDERTTHWCRLLLRRYGVMFRDLLANESAAPSWGSLVRAYRRLEARGEVRGGRFVAGVAGEQYALTEVIPPLRLATETADEKALVLPATDPLNFTGWIGSETRVPALPGRMIAIVQGKVTAYEEQPRNMDQVARQILQID